MTYGKSLRETLLAFMVLDREITLNVSTSAGKEITGHLRAVTDDTVLLGSEKRPYHVALAHIVAVQEA